MLKESKRPDVNVANWTFLLMTVLLLTGSSLLINLLGVGINLWINELIWILGLVLFIIWKKGYAIRKTFHLKKTKPAVIILAAITGFTIWFPSMYIYSLVNSILTNSIGPYSIEMTPENTLQTFFFVTGIVILAPICEELFFRGFMQSAYSNFSRKYGWLIVGIIFGAFHLTNGISDVFSATLVGVTISYVLYVTDSIWLAIVIHAFNNLASVLFESTPQIVMVLVALIIGILSVLILKNKYGKKEKNKKEIKENTVDESLEKQKRKSTKRKFVALWIAVVVLLTLGFSEVLIRSKIIEIPVNSNQTNIKIAEGKEMKQPLAEFEIEDSEDYIFEWEVDYESSYNDIVFKLVAPDGSITYEKGPISSTGMTYDTSEGFTINGKGEWKFILEGDVEDFKLNFRWDLT